MLAGRGGSAPVGGPARGREATGKDMMANVVLQEVQRVFVLEILYQTVEPRLSCWFTRGSSVLSDRQWEASRNGQMDSGALLLKQ